jgi:DNA-binding response OmpR family regulator
MNRDAGKTVLLIDDDRHLLVTLSDYMTFEGFHVLQATSGEEALRIAERERPDLAVLDISMPGIGGLGFLRAITNPDGSRRFPVLVMTARAAMEGFFETVGADGFVAKPCSGVELVREIRTVLTGGKVRAAGATAPRGRVLLIENHAVTAKTLSSAFTDAGYTVDVVEHGLELFRKVGSSPPAVIVAKEMLPQMTGSAIALMAKGHHTTQSIPFLLYDDSRLLAAQMARGDHLPRGVDSIVFSNDAAELLGAMAGLLRKDGKPATH